MLTWLMRSAHLHESYCCSTPCFSRHLICYSNILTRSSFQRHCHTRCLGVAGDAYHLHKTERNRVNELGKKDPSVTWDGASWVMLIWLMRIAHCSRMYCCRTPCLSRHSMCHSNFLLWNLFHASLSYELFRLDWSFVVVVGIVRTSS